VDDRFAAWLNKLARRDPTIQRFVGVAADQLARVEVVLMLLLALSGRRGSAVRMLSAVGLVYVASEVLGLARAKQRPFARVPGVVWLIPHSPRRSFPSRHVASGLAMAAIGSREHPRLGMLMASVAWLLGITRVAAGLHYPSDVLAGAALGQAVGRYVRRL
jgi:undecaprenyl-diphosphatase